MNQELSIQWFNFQESLLRILSKIIQRHSSWHCYNRRKLVSTLWSSNGRIAKLLYPYNRVDNFKCLQRKFSSSQNQIQHIKLLTFASTSLNKWWYFLILYILFYFLNFWKWKFLIFIIRKSKHVCVRTHSFSCVRSLSLKLFSLHQAGKWTSAPAAI